MILQSDTGMGWKEFSYQGIGGGVTLWPKIEKYLKWSENDPG